MAHLAVAMFFGLVFVGAGVAVQMLVREFRREIVAAFLRQPPVRQAKPEPRIRVTVRALPERHVPLAAVA